ncbi:MAG: heavy-metal-associated domain-containing protein [Clostridia bacterium]|jgi:copper chaperone CopZ|nr:heavy-metal-associated domain-containing protein [Clostridia bacterium]
MKEIIIKVKGMMCGGCENRVKNAIKDIEGVENVIADHTTGEVIITTNDNVSQNIIEEVIEDIGYEVVK